MKFINRKKIVSPTLFYDYYLIIIISKVGFVKLATRWDFNRDHVILK